MIILFLLSLSPIFATQMDQFDSFVIDTNKVYNVNSKLGDAFNVVTEIGTCSDGIVIKASDPITLIKINTQGQETGRLAIGGYDGYWEGNRIYWDSSNFVVPVAGGIQQYNYDLTLNSSFGNSGTASFASVNISGTNYSVQFSSVTKSGNYYYALGYYNTSVNTNTIRPIIVRFTLTGTVDLSFNISDTAGYAIIPTTETVLEMNEILILKNNIIIKTYNSYMISVPLNGPYNSYMILSGITPTSSMTAASDNNSFFTFNNNTIYKYTGDLEPDVSFNGTGSIGLTEANSLFVGPVAIYAVTRIGTRLFIAGEYPDGLSRVFPFIACYDISNSKNPMLDTSFFNKGYFIPDSSLYPNSIHGVFKITFTPTIIPSLFFTSGHYVTHVLLPEEISRATVVTTPIISKRLAFEEAKGNKIPLLAGMF